MVAPMVRHKKLLQNVVEARDEYERKYQDERREQLRLRKQNREMSNNLEHYQQQKEEVKQSRADQVGLKAECESLKLESQVSCLPPLPLLGRLSEPAASDSCHCTRVQTRERRFGLLGDAKEEQEGKAETKIRELQDSAVSRALLLFTDLLSDNLLACWVRHRAQKSCNSCMQSSGRVRTITGDSKPPRIRRR